MNKIKIFVPHQEKKKKKKNKEKREMHADRFFVYYQIGVALYLFTKDWNGIKYIDLLTLLLVCIQKLLEKSEWFYVLQHSLWPKVTFWCLI